MRTLAVLLALTATPVWAQDFDGLYRPAGSDWDCRSVGSDGGALSVRDGVLYGVESACSLTNPTRVNGMNAMLFDAECSGEGETYSYRVMLMQIAGGLAVIQDGSVSELERCD